MTIFLAGREALPNGRTPPCKVGSFNPFKIINSFEDDSKKQPACEQRSNARRIH